jgi:hypothetical protein
MPRHHAWALALTLLPTLVGAAPQPEPFFQRLESIGLDTTYLRDLTDRIGLRFRSSTRIAEASWGFVENRLYMPPGFAEEGTEILRFDLATHELDTLIHEYVHAANDLDGRSGAPVDTVGRQHRDCLDFIWADIHQDPAHNLLGLARYPRAKANEVTGYFMGQAIGEVFQVVEEVVAYNTQMEGARVASSEEAERLGGTLVLPPEDAPRGWARRLATARFGQVSVYDTASFRAGVLAPTLIHWDEYQRGWLKERMYENLLGLHPPRDSRELVERLNALQSPWIRGVRRRVQEARAAYLEAAPAVLGEEPSLFGLVGPVLD